MVLACLVQLLMEMFPGYFWSAPGYEAYDLTIETFSDTAKTAFPNRRIVLIAIDEETYEKIGNPSFTPNRVVAELVTRAVSLKPMSVLVDIDISHEIDTADGEALKSVLEAYPDKKVPPLILVREIGLDNMVPATRYDSVVSDNPNITWASSVVRPDFDGVVRGYYDDASCGSNSHTLPSAVSLFAQSNEDTSLGRPGDSRRCEVDGLQKRFLYSFEDELDEGRRRAQTKMGDVKRPVFQKISAHSFLASEILNTDFFAGATIVIGNTHAAARDEHITPFGSMPGVFILANAVYSQSTFGPIRSLPLWQSLILVCVITTIPVSIFLGFKEISSRYPDTLGMLSSPTWPTIVVSVMLFLVWYLVSPWLLFDHGIWVDIVAPQVLVAVWLEIIEVWSLTTEVKALRVSLKSIGGNK